MVEIGILLSTPWVVGSLLKPDLRDLRVVRNVCCWPPWGGRWRWTLTESLILAQDERWRRA